MVSGHFNCWVAGSFKDKLNDNDDIMKQMRGLYARANSVLREFAACSFEVKLRLFQAFCTSFYCAHLWYKFNQTGYVQGQSGI